MAQADNPLSDRDIDASNVRPAFEASLRFGASEELISLEVGWSRTQLETDGMRVTGASTYRHMELMYRVASERYADFVLAATALHTVSTLGVVGLACKTAATVGDALACHQRYQHLTNRTARYTSSIEDVLTVSEQRHGPDSLGSRLISDYTMLIAVQLLRDVASVAPHVVALRSRRNDMPAEERRRYESFLKADIRVGCPRAQLLIDKAIVAAPVATGDPELAAYFAKLLQCQAPDESEPALLSAVRQAIHDSLPHGTPTAAQVARALGLGQRTLQRRLASLGHSYGAVLDSARRNLAVGYLKRDTLSLAEVAYLLGYSEQASFFRSFRRWFGTTPAAFRRTQQ